MVLILEEHKRNIKGPLPPLEFVKRFFGDQSLLLPSKVKAEIAKLEPHFPFLFGSTPVCEWPSEGHRKGGLVCKFYILTSPLIRDNCEDSIV
jgi:hypothetical protein